MYYIPVHFMIRSTPVAFSRSLGCGGKDMVSTTPFAGCTDPRSRKHQKANIFAILILKNLFKQRDVWIGRFYIINRCKKAPKLRI